MRGGDVGDAAQRSVLAVRPGCLAPAVRCDTALLAEQRQEDLGLLRAEPRQRLEPAQHLAAVGGPVLRAFPDGLGASAVVLDERPAQLLHPLRHRAGEAVHRRGPRDERGELLRVGLGDPGGVQVTEPVLQDRRAAEGLLHRDLLVEQHAEQQRQRIAAQQRVGVGVLGQVEGCHRPIVPQGPAPCRSVLRCGHPHRGRRRTQHASQRVRPAGCRP